MGSQLLLQLQTAFENASALIAPTAVKATLASATAAAPAVRHTQPKPVGGAFIVAVCTAGGTFIVAVGTAPYEVGGTP